MLLIWPNLVLLQTLFIFSLIDFKLRTLTQLLSLLINTRRKFTLINSMAITFYNRTMNLASFLYANEHDYIWETLQFVCELKWTERQTALPATNPNLFTSVWSDILFLSSGVCAWLNPNGSVSAETNTQKKTEHISMFNLFRNRFHGFFTKCLSGIKCINHCGRLLATDSLQLARRAW